MSVDFEKHKLQENLKRQSKRLSELIDVPLTKAQYLLAVHIYSEVAFEHVKAKIDNGKFTGLIFLAAVASDADDQILDKFLSEFGEIYQRTENSPLASLYQGPTRELIFRLFDLEVEQLSSLR